MTQSLWFRFHIGVRLSTGDWFVGFLERRDGLDIFRLVRIDGGEVDKIESSGGSGQSGVDCFIGVFLFCWSVGVGGWSIMLHEYWFVGFLEGRWWIG